MAVFNNTITVTAVGSGIKLSPIKSSDGGYTIDIDASAITWTPTITKHSGPTPPTTYTTTYPATITTTSRFSRHDPTEGMTKGIKRAVVAESGLEYVSCWYDPARAQVIIEGLWRPHSRDNVESVRAAISDEETHTLDDQEILDLVRDRLSDAMLEQTLGR